MNYAIELAGGPHDGTQIEATLDLFTGDLRMSFTCDCGCRGIYHLTRILTHSGRLIYRWWPGQSVLPRTLDSN